MDVDCNATMCEHNYKLNCLRGVEDGKRGQVEQIDKHGVATFSTTVEIGKNGRCVHYQEKG
ncbi:MAG: hypothetical protein B6I36_07650 [Desulfobacteraceae bacterium 4572_35.1]|nr:MAG: hypothetical protein B6I36_07650 [Desulfobacteraceae bacterium 4572_35.1]